MPEIQKFYFLSENSLDIDTIRFVEVNNLFQ